MKRRVLFFHPKRKSCKARTPHLGLAIMSRLLKDAGYEVKVVDYVILEDSSPLEGFLYSYQPDVVGISLYTAVFEEAMDILAKVVRYNSRLPIMIGGPHATLYADELRGDDRISYICKGECENYIVPLVAQAKKEAVPKVFEHSITDVTNVPFPDFTSFYGFERIQDYPLMTSRGCPYACSFCAVKLVSTQYCRLRAPEVCIDELRMAKRTYPNIKGAAIFDDNPTADRKHFKDFLRLFVEANLGLQLGISYFRADHIDEELIELVKKAGARDICIAVEHGHPEVYKHIRKGETFEDFRRAADLVKSSGLALGLNFIIGLPEDTLEKTMYSIKMARELKADFIYWGMAHPFPGTRMYEWFEEHGKLYKAGGHTSLREWDFRCDEPIADTPEFTREERRKARFIAVLGTNQYILKPRDIPEILWLTVRYGVYLVVTRWFIKQMLYIPRRLALRLRRTHI